MSIYENKRSRYKKVCPFCKAIGEAYRANNIICRCGAKFYWTGKVWLNRNTGEEVKESEVAKRREDIEKSPVDCSTPSVTDSKGDTE